MIQIPTNLPLREQDELLHEAVRLGNVPPRIFKTEERRLVHSIEYEGEETIYLPLRQALMRIMLRRWAEPTRDGVPQPYISQKLVSWYSNCRHWPELEYPPTNKNGDINR